ncbi:MAG: spore germination protein GerW family protein [Thermomicrobiales bacterium]
MQVSEFVNSARDALTVKRVFGDPYEKDGVTVIPVAKIGGGAGGGGGDSEEGSGSGGGFGLSAKPAGAYVVRDGDVTWQPAIDVNRIVMGGQIVAVVLLLVLGSIFRTRARASNSD